MSVEIACHKAGGEARVTPEAIGGSPIRQAIANAAQATGQDFEFLLATAVRESSLNPRAEARTSSATGLFQFLDATWLTTLKRHGAKHGLGAEASMIEMGGDGKPYVSDPSMRRALLDLRYDAEISARMAAEFANDNADHLRARTGVEPEPGDLYAAHFLGAGGAAELVMAVRDTPWARAADLFPAAAGANRPIFYAENGRGRTVAEVLENLRQTAAREAPPVSSRELGGGAVHLFGPRRDPMSDAFQSFRSSASFNSQPNDFVRILQEQGAAFAGGQELSFDPAMLAQLYSARDQMNEAAAFQAVSAVMSSGSIAAALAPEPSPPPPPPPVALRGRS